MEYIKKLKLLINENKRRLLFITGIILLILTSILVLIFSNSARKKADKNFISVSIENISKFN